jgi:hypothetical protein
MLWVALYLAGVPIWLVLGALPVALWNRHRALRTPGSFACKVREIRSGPPRTRRSLWRLLTGRSARPAPSRFPLLPATGWWVSDVLVVQGAVGLAPARLLAVAAGDSVRRADDAGRGLGEGPRSVLLILTDGHLVEVAVAAGDAGLLAGPLTARAPVHRT